MIQTPTACEAGECTPQPIPLIILAGATGTGKSAAAMRIAESVDGVIVNADSRQVYRDFPIITAQPPREDLARVPHVLYGFLASGENLGAGAYAERAAQTVREIHGQGKIPILTGGTGLYLRTLVRGIAPIPSVPPAVAALWRSRCAAEGPQALHALLRERDPESAARLHPNDAQRITRALEVLEATGKPLGYWHTLPLPPSPYRVCALRTDMPLAAIEPRLAARVDAMLEAGAVAEAERARLACPDPRAPGWSGIGCAELLHYLEGKTPLDECRAQWIANTRAYAKRQITWFRSEKHMTPFPSDDVDAMVRFCREQLHL